MVTCSLTYLERWLRTNCQYREKTHISIAPICDCQSIYLTEIPIAVLGCSWSVHLLQTKQTKTKQRTFSFLFFPFFFSNACHSCVQTSSLALSFPPSLTPSFPWSSLFLISSFAKARYNGANLSSMLTHTHTHRFQHTWRWGQCFVFFLFFFFQMDIYINLQSTCQWDKTDLKPLFKHEEPLRRP